tara:strand:+ start:644 stop:1372 length:729 start_codon:yes stop_codon:yes gene_type:complete
MKKVAIVMCGLPRTYKKTNEIFFSNLINSNKKEYIIDVFLGFWDHTHVRGEGGSRSSIRKINKQEIEDILNIYSPKKHIVFDDYEDKNKNYFSNIANQLVLTIGFPRHPDGVSLIKNGVVAQTYGWFKTFSLIDEEYDIVVKSRFDIVMENINFNNFKIGEFNCAGPRHQFPQYGLADALFGSDQSTMQEIMVNFHNDIIDSKIPNISNLYPNVFAEYILKDLLYRKKISVNYLNKKVEIVR